MVITTTLCIHISLYIPILNSFSVYHCRIKHKGTSTLPTWRVSIKTIKDGDEAQPPPKSRPTSKKFRPWNRGVSSTVRRMKFLHKAWIGLGHPDKKHPASLAMKKTIRMICTEKVSWPEQRCTPQKDQTSTRQRS